MVIMRALVELLGGAAGLLPLLLLLLLIIGHVQPACAAAVSITWPDDTSAPVIANANLTLLNITSVPARASLTVRNCTIDVVAVADDLELLDANITFDACVFRRYASFNRTVLRGRSRIEVRACRFHEEAAADNATANALDLLAPLLHFDRVVPLSSSASIAVLGCSFTSVLLRESFVHVALGGAAAANASLPPPPDLVFDEVSVCNNNVTSRSLGYLVYINLLQEAAGRIVNCSGQRVITTDAVAVISSEYLRVVYVRLFDRHDPKSRTSSMHSVIADRNFVSLGPGIAYQDYNLRVAVFVARVTYISMQHNIALRALPTVSMPEGTSLWGSSTLYAELGVSNVDNVVVANNWAEVASAGQVWCIIVNLRSASGVGTVNVSRNYCNVSSYSYAQVLYIAFDDVDGVEHIDVADNRVIADMGPTHNYIMLNGHAQAIVISSLTGMAPVLNLRLLTVRNNSGVAVGSGSTCGVFILASFVDCGSILVEDTSLVVRAHGSLATQNNTTPSCVRIADAFVNVSSIVVQRCNCSLSAQLALNAVGVYIAARVRVRDLRYIAFRNNVVTMTKQGYFQSEVTTACYGVDSNCFVEQLGDVEIVNNTGVLVARDRCSPAACSGFSFAFSRGAAGIKSLLLAENRFDISSNVGSSVAGVAISVLNAAMERFGLLDPATFTAKLQPASAIDVGNFTFLNNTVRVASPEYVLGVFIKVSGSLVARRMVIENLHVVNAASDGACAVFQCAALYLGCPSGNIIGTPDNAPNVTLTFTIECAARSAMSFSHGISVTNLTAHGLGTLIDIATALTAPWIDVSNSTLRAWAPPALARAAAPNPKRAVFGGILVRRWASAVGAFSLRGLRLTATRRCSIANVDPTLAEFVDLGELVECSQVILSDVAASLVCSDAPSRSGAIVRLTLVQLPRASARRDVCNVTRSALVVAASAGFAVAVDALSVSAPGVTTAVHMFALNVSVGAGSASDRLIATAAGGASGFDATLRCVTWNGGPVLHPMRTPSVLRSINAISTAVVMPCAGVVPSRTASSEVSESLSPPHTRSIALTATRTISPFVEAPPIGLAEHVVTRLANAATYASMTSGLLAGNPGVMLGAARGVALMRLALCHLNTAPAVGPPRHQHPATLRNFTRHRMARDVPLPQSLLPGLHLGVASGASYRGAIAGDIAAIAVAALACLFAGSINRSKWVEHLAAKARDAEAAVAAEHTGEGGSASRTGRRRREPRVSVTEDDGALSVVEYAPLDRFVLRPLTMILPFWAEVAGALLWAQPAGGGDAALAVVPLALVLVFCCACAHHVYTSVRPVPHAARRSAAHAGAADDDLDEHIAAKRGGSRRRPRRSTTRSRRRLDRREGAAGAAERSDAAAADVGRA